MINNDNFSIITAFLIGLLGNIHCLGMCSGIITLLSLSISKDKKKQIIFYQLYYNLGRILGYIITNVLAFSLGILIIKILGIDNLKFLKLISGITLTIISLHLLNTINLIKSIENLGYNIWNYLNKYSTHLFPVKNPLQAIFLGIFWSNLPCGLTYSTLIWSISSASLYKSIILMLAFGLGTLPSMISVGLVFNKTKNISKNKLFKKILSMSLLIIGILDIYNYFNNKSCH